MTIIWEPTQERVNAANVTRFWKYIEDRYDVNIANYSDLHTWSIENREKFWLAVWDFCCVMSEQSGNEVIVDDGRMVGTRFFPDAKLNFAENLLKRRDDHDAIIFQSETGFTERLTFNELYGKVSQLSQALSDFGIQSGDRLAAIMPNIPETVICSQAGISIGATWSSCSPDFGVKGILDRFQQIKPRVLFVCDGYFYNGKEIDILEKVKVIIDELPSVEQVIIVPYIGKVKGQSLTLNNISQTRLLDDLLTEYEPLEINFKQLPFDHPLYIMFTSGTTGKPKCIVHRAGGVLLQHLKDHTFHLDLKENDRFFWFTTCGWMMWNFLISGLASKATLLLFDGSPTHPQPQVLFDFAEREAMTHFGVSAKYFQAIEKAGLSPINTHNLSTLQFIGSTGSVLLPESHEYVYKHIKEDVLLGSVTGGTDILGAFAGSSPVLPVRKEEIQAKSLGMAVEIWNDDGEKVINEKGEFVCTKAFPSMPLGFWNDPDSTRYHAAYFEYFTNVWSQRDFAEETGNSGFIMYGRSDATLNPGGVRIGTAELYRQVEQFDYVMESVAIGQFWKGDVRIILFVLMREGNSLTEEKIAQLKEQIRKGASPKHVPTKIIEVKDIPRTRTGKITELAIRDVINDLPVKNSEAIANPESLKYFQGLAELNC